MVINASAILTLSKFNESNIPPLHTGVLSLKPEVIPGITTSASWQSEEDGPLLICGRKSVLCSMFSQTVHVWNRSLNFCIKYTCKTFFPDTCVSYVFVFESSVGNQFLPKCLCAPSFTTKNTIKVISSFSIPNHTNGHKFVKSHYRWQHCNTVLMLCLAFIVPSVLLSWQGKTSGRQWLSRWRALAKRDFA